MAARTCRLLERVIQFPRLASLTRPSVDKRSEKLLPHFKYGVYPPLTRLLCTAEGAKPYVKESLAAAVSETSQSENDGGLFQYDNNDHSTVIMARSLLKNIESTFDEKEVTCAERNCIEEIGTEIDKLVTTSSSLLGLTADELKNRFDFLKDHHVHPVFALRIALSFPSLLSIDTERAGRILDMFHKYSIDVNTFRTNPLLLSLDPDTVESNFNTLLKSGLIQKSILDLVFRYPLCLAFPLSKHSLDTMKNFSRAGSEESSAFLSRILQDSFNFVSVKFKRNRRFQEGAQLLNEVGIPVNIILGKYPEFFNQTGKHLRCCFDYLCGKPLFFDMESMRDYIKRNPDVFVRLNQDPVQDLVRTIHEITKDSNRLFSIFIRKPRLFTNPELVLERIALFRRWHFTDQDLRKLLVASHTAFLNERGQLEQRLEFLLSHGDVNTADISRHGMVLTCGMPLMKARIGFLREKNISALQNRETKDIFWSDNATFATDICNSTAEEFEAYVQKNLHFERRSESNKKRKRKKILRGEDDSD